MTDKERQDILKSIKENKKIALQSKESALKYLFKAGILTKKGNISSSYKSGLCIAGDRD